MIEKLDLIGHHIMSRINERIERRYTDVESWSSRTYYNRFHYITYPKLVTKQINPQPVRLNPCSLRMIPPTIRPFLSHPLAPGVPIQPIRKHRKMRLAHTPLKHCCLHKWGMALRRQNSIIFLKQLWNVLVKSGMDGDWDWNWNWYRECALANIWLCYRTVCRPVKLNNDSAHQQQKRAGFIINACYH